MSITPRNARKDTKDFKEVIGYGYANHKNQQLTDKITNIEYSVKDEKSVIDYTGIDELELYVDKSIREGYTGRAVPKIYH